MRLAIIAPTFLPALRANTFQVMKMAQALVAIGHQVRVAVPDPQTRAAPSGWEALANHYGLVHHFPIDWIYAHPKLRRYDYGWRSVNWAHRWGADLIYTRLPQAAALASTRGLAVILEVHDLPQGRFGPWMFQRFWKGEGARRLVVISRALAQDLAVKFGISDSAPFTLIAPDGVDLERYAALLDPPQARQVLIQQKGLASSLSVERFTVGYTGSFYAGRGVELLLEVASCLPEMNMLLVGGEAGDVDRIRSLASAARLENIEISGFVSNEDLPLFQAACDVLLMPYQRRVAASSGGDISRYLSPMKLFEYMACGRAIVSSNLSVLTEILSFENAILVPPDDVDAWVKAIRDLFEKPELRSALALRASQDARRYTWEQRAALILDGITTQVLSEEIIHA
jgi:glycosyltransferase involved in cell wall biosynthesis